MSADPRPWYRPLEPEAQRRAAVRTRTVAAGALPPRLRAAMWELFARYYCDSTEATFAADLAGKDHVLALETPRGELVGFSTVQRCDHPVDGRCLTAVFSGDTIVDRAYWGTEALRLAFLRYIVATKIRRPLRPVYWFLITKGYRTYLLLTRNFPVHWPRYDRPTPPWERAIIASLARARFGDRFSSATGVLSHGSGTGRLRAEVAPVDAALLEQSPEIRFFARQNPGHAAGDELCCLGLVNPAQWLYYLTRTARKHLGRADRRPRTR